MEEFEESHPEGAQGLYKPGDRQTAAKLVDAQVQVNPPEEGSAAAKLGGAEVPADEFLSQSRLEF
jgi:hypothetical protein